MKPESDLPGTPLENCTFIKVILILSVIAYHSLAMWMPDGWFQPPAQESIVLGYLASWLGSFHIFAFTLVSGYLFAFKVRGHGGYGSYRHLLQNKAKRLLVPYVFAMSIWVAPISACYYNWDFGYLFKKYILCIDPSQLWFLWMLFGVFSFVWPLRNPMLEKPAVGWAASILFYGIGSIGRMLLPNVFCIWTACQYVPFFYMGMRIRCREEGKMASESSPPWAAWFAMDVCLFLGSAFIGSLDTAIGSLLKHGVDFILHMVGAVMAWATLQALASHINWRKSYIISRLSACSMPMYLFHQQIIYFTISLMDGKASPWAIAGVNFAAAFIGSFLISTMLMHWRITRILVGEK